MFKQRFPHITTLAAYGCSFTAGAELGDHLISPKAETVKRKKGTDHWWRLFGNITPALMQNVIDYERSHSWPSRAAERLGLVSDNRAQNGTALGSAVWRFEQDLFNQRWADPTNTLFVFGVTTPDRVKLFELDPVRTLRIANPIDQPKHWCMSTITDIFTDGLLIWNHLQLLERIAVLAQRLDLTIAVFNAFAPRPLAYYHIVQQDLALIEHQRHYINTLPGFFLLEPSMTEFIGEGERLGCGHPNALAHDRFAEHVVYCLDSLA